MLLKSKKRTLVYIKLAPLRGRRYLMSDNVSCCEFSTATPHEERKRV